MNRAPDWIKGTFIYKLLLADQDDALEVAAKQIRATSNLLDRSVRQCVFLLGAVGVDDSLQAHDGSWPFLNRPTFRINHSWHRLYQFMSQMRDECNAWISFHLNLTDVNAGLMLYPETRDFFQRLVENRCIYTRDGGECGQPYRGLAYVPSLPLQKPRMNYVRHGDADDIIGIVNYLRFWESGMAREQIDQLYSRLPYPPLVIMLDVFSPTGNNLCAGYPDGALGGSYETQMEGRTKIMNHFRSLGTAAGVEGMSSDADYGWAHGGLAWNDYSRIGSGYGQGAAAFRSAKVGHVYGNQGGYHVIVPGRNKTIHLKEMQRADGKAVATFDPQSSIGETTMSDGKRMSILIGRTGKDAEQEHARMVGDEIDLAQSFYMTVIQELYHISKGNVRLPRGDNCKLLDESQGRLQIDCFYLTRRGKLLETVEAETGDLDGTCVAKDHPKASGGKLVGGMQEALFSGIAVQICAPSAGNYDLIVRYISAAGAVTGLQVNAERTSDVIFPATGDENAFGDHALSVTLKEGINSIRFFKARLYAEWDDGTKAQWDEAGLSIWNRGVTFAAGFDRMWPDTWSGQIKVYFFSYQGCQKAWTLPQDWSEVQQAFLHPLTPHGRGAGLCLRIREGCVEPRLEARVPYVLAL